MNDCQLCIKIMLKNYKIICFSPMLLQVFFDKKAIISSLNNKSLLIIGNNDFKRRPKSGLPQETTY